MMTSREVVRRTIAFSGPDRLAVSLGDSGDDIAMGSMWPHVDARPEGGKGTDEWGCVWDNVGVCQLGEVKEYPLKEWSDWAGLKVPDVTAAERWEKVPGTRQEVGEKYLMGHGMSLYERAHYLRGLENVWVDIHQARGELEKMLDLFVDMNLEMVKRYAAADYDAIIWCDDWGLQDRLMIAPDSWRAIWKKRYGRVYEAAHAAGLATILHSCGHIVAILDDLIEVGLDVIQMDQQENMGLELLGERFGGRITFWSPVDIQGTMVKGSLDDIRAYCRKMVKLLGRPNGGFIGKWYPDPVGVGHRGEAIAAMSETFLQTPVGG